MKLHTANNQYVNLLNVIQGIYRVAKPKQGTLQFYFLSSAHKIINFINTCCSYNERYKQ